MTDPQLAQHEHYMRLCIALAWRARDTKDTPVGSIIVQGNVIVAEGVEAVRGRQDVTAHAEMEAIRAACKKLKSLDLTGCTLYTSVEPCVMCAYAIRLARVSPVVAGSRSADNDSSLRSLMALTDVNFVPNRPPLIFIRDVLADECAALLIKAKEQK
jgi:tRNA(adenine34) deaminase